MPGLRCCATQNKNKNTAIVGTTAVSIAPNPVGSDYELHVNMMPGRAGNPGYKTPDSNLTKVCKVYPQVSKSSDFYLKIDLFSCGIYFFFMVFYKEKQRIVLHYVRFNINLNCEWNFTNIYSGIFLI